jgi:hypothetical protein
VTVVKILLIYFDIKSMHYRIVSMPLLRLDEVPIITTRIALQQTLGFLLSCLTTIVSRELSCRTYSSDKH